MIERVADQMQQRLDANLNLGRQLVQALERGEFVLHYQPQVSLRSGRMIGIEALIRWQSPELGLVPPNTLPQLDLLRDHPGDPMPPE